ncbi:hypothetical protein [Nocardioides astragali]|uniref:PLD phosphodiesterase domain-containing protein n=1 Tax=Nocardioides astragali TaxID=1776736 RepID=A0ABW2N093_9ACTN|nr:hypothetical protein [Nocardioides astragali]
MATFLPFVAVAAVQRGGPDVLVTLPDPPRQPGEPLVRPGVARLAGAQLMMVPLVPQGGGTVNVHSPVTGPCRQVDLTATPIAALPGVSILLEISPLPFAAAAVLRRLPGLPVFYVAVPALASPPPDDHLVAAGEQLGTEAIAWVGALFDDRLALSPLTVMGLIGDAMPVLDTNAEVADWQRLADELDVAGRTLRVLDHAGRPGASYRVRVVAPAGTTVQTADATGSLTLPAGDLELRWIADEDGDPVDRPVHALVERSLADADDLTTSSAPGESIAIPAALAHGHLQVLDAGRWFADRSPGLLAGLGNVHPRSRLQPLVDGFATFAPMLDDLRAATGPGCGAHFAGWSFNDFPLDLDDQAATMLTELVRALTKGGGAGAEADGARFLIDQYIHFRDDAPAGDDLEAAAVLLLILGYDAMVVAGLLGRLPRDPRWLVAMVSLAALAAYVVGAAFAGDILEFLEGEADESKGMAEVLNAIRPNIALRAHHPARFSDNPLVVPNPLPVAPSAYLHGVSSWHQKFQVIRRTPDALGNEVVGYVGGIDMNKNRLDGWGHHGSKWRPADGAALSPAPEAGAFHDVHARITGPAAADVALTFERRWALDTNLQPAPGPTDPPIPGVAFTAPDPTDPEVPPQPARHLVQVGRSGYRPAPGGEARALPWSPLGETTVSDALVNAIGSAREYIYIEDQYFTPHDEYVAALLDAAVREPALRLVVVMPSSSDQVFGDVRHAEMFELLRDGRNGDGYGDRMIVAAPVRRPRLGDGGRVASLGRLVLQEDLPATGDQILVGPRSRLPEVSLLSPFVPFWLWVDGERMLAVEQRDDVLSTSEVPSRRFLLSRATGPTNRWGAQPRLHTAGAAVTMAQVPGIYVHTKAIMVDDIFVGIGSCNTNRRGFFHDGEIQAFAVPEQLKASRENPALALRTALWAEHLGIPPAMGPTLLADPVAAFELLRRSTYLGNRMSTFEALGARTELALLGESVQWAETVATLFGTVSTDVLPYAWNTLIEPTTASDLTPRLGPGIGTV